MLLGDQLNQKETLNIEYKEFCLKTNIFNNFSLNEIKCIINSGNINCKFNDLIYKNIEIYFKLYIPKYASAFHNSNIQNGSLYIGINDYGEITGIPWSLTNLDPCSLSELAKNVLRLQNIKNIDLDICLIKLDYNLDILTSNSDLYIKKMKETKKKYMQQTTEYYSKRKHWVKNVLKYSCKLSHIIKFEEQKLQFFKWILFQKCSDKVKKFCISIQPEEIECIKYKRDFINDENHPICWIARFKDVMMKKHQREKPEYPELQKIFNGYVYLITHLSHMRKKFLENTDNLNYYIIQLNFNIRPSNSYLDYYRLNGKKYRSFRLISSNGPYCKSEIIT